MKKVLSLIAVMCVVLARLAACAAPAALVATDVPTVASTTGPADGLPATTTVGVNSQNRRGSKWIME